MEHVKSVNSFEGLKDLSTVFSLPHMTQVHKYDSSTEEYPEPPQIRMTDQYDRFTLLDFNRDISTSNMRKLMQLTAKKFQMHKFPILVTKDFEIIDGQHRFEACRQLGCPIYYIIDDIKSDKVCWKIVHDKNIAGRKHTLKDKIAMLEKEGHPMISKTMNIRFEYAKDLCSPTLVLRLLHCFGNSGTTAHVLNSGAFRMNYEAETKLLLLWARTTLGVYECKWRDSFLLAVSTVWKRAVDRKFDLPLNKFLERLATNEFMFTKKKSYHQFEDMVIETYNYRLAQDKRI